MLQLDDIQGNILAGFNTDFQVFVGLTNSNEGAWREIANWVASLAPEVTTVAELKSSRQSMKRAFDSNETWLSISVGERFMSKTQPDVLFLDDAFRNGMVRRAGPVLGDKTDPRQWEIGKPDQPIDILFIVGANNEQAAWQRADVLQTSAVHLGLSVSYTETGLKFKDLEHFGFRDGISQPQVAGIDPLGTFEPGHFVYGYPKIPGGPPIKVYADPRDVTRNGSLLVFRRLEQHVDKFRAFCTRKAAELQAHMPSLSPEHLQALLVGRWPSGALVSFNQTTDPGFNPDADSFDFTNDTEGKSCPLGAHIRKVNPRLGPRDVSEVPRMLRRGIPFGRPYDEKPDEKRGLLFISFQTSIRNTFEFISTKWMNAPEKPGRDPGHDFIVGQYKPLRNINLNCPAGRVSLSDDGETWITPTGGCYLFTPSRSGLAKFAEVPSVSINTIVGRNWMRLMDFVAG